MSSKNIDIHNSDTAPVKNNPSNRPAYFKYTCLFTLLYFLIGISISVLLELFKLGAYSAYFSSEILAIFLTIRLFVSRNKRNLTKKESFIFSICFISTRVLLYGSIIIYTLSKWLLNGTLSIIEIAVTLFFCGIVASVITGLDYLIIRFTSKQTFKHQESKTPKPKKLNNKFKTSLILASIIVIVGITWHFVKPNPATTSTTQTVRLNTAPPKKNFLSLIQSKTFLNNKSVQTGIRDITIPEEIVQLDKVPEAVVDLYASIKDSDYRNPQKFNLPKPKKITKIPKLKLKAKTISPLPPTQFPLGKGTTKVVFASPVGQAGIVTQIVIDYEKDQVPVGISDASNVDFSLKPKAKGTLFFASPTRLIYELENPLPFATRYTVKSNNAMFKFDTARPKIKQILANNYQIVPRTGELFIEFNQPMDPKSLSRHGYIKLSHQEKKIPITISEFDPSRSYNNWAIKRMSPKNSYIIKSAATLPNDATFNLNILAGAKGLSGPLELEKSVSQNFSVNPTPMFLGIELFYDKKSLEPNRYLKLKFSTDINVNSLLSAIRVYPSEGIKLELNEDQLETFRSNIYLNYSGFQPRENYVLYFISPIKANDGTEFTPKPYPIFFSDYRPSLEAPKGIILQEKINKPTIPISYRNYEAISLQAKPLTSAYAITNYLNKLKPRYNKKIDNSFFDFHKTIPTEASPNIMTYNNIQIDSFVPSSKYPIAFNVQAKGSPYSNYSLMQFSNIGITAKLGYLNGLVWINKLAEGISYPDVKISIYNISDLKKPKFSGTSDKNGILLIPGLNTLGHTDELVIMAEKNNDFSFAAGDWNKGISEEDFNLYRQTEKAAGKYPSYYPSTHPAAYYKGHPREGQRAVMFLERKLYSPGEKVNFKAVLRLLENSKLRRLPINKPITIQVHDSKRKELYKKTLKTDEFSSVSDSFLIPENAPLGTYTIRYITQHDTHLESFQVEQFKTQNFNITLSAPKHHATAGSNIEFNGFATYLQGGVMKQANVETWIKQDRATFQPPGYKDYTFTYSPEDKGQKMFRYASQTLLTKTIKTNNDGQFKLTTPTKKYYTPTKVIADVTIQDLQGSRISKSHTILLHPADYYIGIKNGSPLVQANQKMALDLIAVRPDGTRMDTVSVKANVYFEGSEVLRYKSLGNTFLIRQTPTRQLIEKRKFTLSQTKSIFEFIPPHAGRYTLEFESTDNKGNTTKSSRSFRAYGLGDPQWQLYDHDRIDLEANKDSFQVGDTATILIKSPISKGTALLTIEREGILDRYMININSASPVVKIPIKKEYFPNVFVSVTVIQGRISEPPLSGLDLGKPTFRVGYLPLKINSTEHDLTINLETDKQQYQPRETVTLDIDVSELSKERGIADVAIAVVDEALLNLIPNNIDPQASFYRDFPLMVQTAQNRIHFKGSRTYGQKGVDIGGGGGMMSLEDARDLFLNSVYWNPSVRTNDKGKATVSFTVPDNLTTFRIIAFGQTKNNRFGVKETTFKVKKDLSIFTVFPEFLIQGDTFKAGINIHNQSNTQGSAEVTAFSDNLTINGNNTAKINLSKKSVHPAMFKYTANKVGTSNYGFKAVLDDLQDSIKKTVVVHDSLTYETTAAYGRLQQGMLTESIQVPSAATANRGQIKVSLSASKLSSIAGAVDYLNNYHYLCLEQKYAKTVGRVGNTVLNGKKPTNLTKEDSLFINKVIQETDNYFKPDHGLGFWPKSNFSSPYLSSFVGQVLLFYQNIGLSIPETYFHQLDIYFKTILDNPKQTSTNRLLAFNYLAKRGKTREATIERLLSERSSYSLSEQLLLAEGLAFIQNKSKLAKMVFMESKQSLSFESGEAFFDDKAATRFTYMIHPSLYSNILGLKTMLTLTPDDPLVFQLANYLSTTQLQKGFWSNTQENAQMIIAMLKFRQLKESSQVSLKTDISLKDKALGSYQATTITSPPQDFLSPIHHIPATPLPLKLTTTGEGTGYYRIEVKYAVPSSKATQKNHGFQVNRSYYDTRNKLVSPETFKVGELYRIEITMQFNERKDFVVLEDFIPAGFSVINPALGESNRLIQNAFSKYNENPASSYWIEHTELRPERASAYGTNLKNGVYSFSYYVRAAHPGTYTALAPHAEEMYSPEVFGNGRTQTITIHP